jgi:hypothetical protein
MTTHIFIENATLNEYILTDQDGHQFGLIKPNAYYGLKLNYSPTFEKKYVFTDKNGMFTMWLGIDGEIQKIYPNSSVHLEVKPEEYHARIQTFPPPLKTSNMVTPCCHLHGNHRNKLLITPIGDIYSRTSILLAPPVPDRALRLDFV